ncbi:DNA-binding helix-turn-helix protein, partial [Dysosmobacter welbionis]
NESHLSPPLRRLRRRHSAESRPLRFQIRGSAGGQPLPLRGRPPVPSGRLSGPLPPVVHRRLHPGTPPGPIPGPRQCPPWRPPAGLAAPGAPAPPGRRSSRRRYRR